jgi:hypothetical protein
MIVFNDTCFFGHVLPSFVVSTSKLLLVYHKWLESAKYFLELQKVGLKISSGVILLLNQRAIFVNSVVGFLNINLIWA